MKVVFICGSLEPGKDGVGDYVRRLSGGLSALGIHVCAISINERRQDIPMVVEGPIENGMLTVYRFASSLKNADKSVKISNIIKSFDPKLISVQFVLQSFNDKGLPLTAGSFLKSFVGNYPVHIMFHELWSGISSSASLKSKLYKMVQKVIVKSVYKKVAPVSIHTHTPLYKIELNKIGIKSSLLPLFGNIPPINNNFQRGTDEFAVLFFGHIRTNEFIRPFLTDALNYTLAENKKLKVVFIGKNGSGISGWVTVLKELNIMFSIEGILSVEDISAWLYKADIGVSTTPFVLSAKSGTVAAMLEHRLPVVCVSKHSGINNDPALNFNNIKHYDQTTNFTSYIKAENNNSLSFEEIVAKFQKEVLSLETLKS